MCRLCSGKCGWCACSLLWCNPFDNFTRLRCELCFCPRLSYLIHLKDFWVLLYMIEIMKKNTENTRDERKMDRGEISHHIFYNPKFLQLPSEQQVWAADQRDFKSNLIWLASVFHKTAVIDAATSKRRLIRLTDRGVTEHQPSGATASLPGIRFITFDLDTLVHWLSLACAKTC